MRRLARSPKRNKRKVVSGSRVTLPGNFAYKPELSFNPLARVTLALGLSYLLVNRALNYNSERHASIIFTLCLDEIQGSKNHFSTWLHPTGLHSGEDQSFQLHIGGKKIGVNKTANPEDVFKTCHLK